jgi:hypothetical protein
VNAHEVESGWMQQISIIGIDELRIECDQMSLAIETDASLSDMVQLICEPAQNAPILKRADSRLEIRQNSRYRGRVRPLLRVPGVDCPETSIKIDKGDLAVNQMHATLGISLGMGDIAISGSTGQIGIKLGKGDIALTDVAGEVGVKQGMGDVAVRRCAGPVVVACGRGDVSVAESGPDIEVSSGSGDIAVRQALGGDLKLSTGNGDILIDKGEAASAQVKTANGDIFSTLRMVPDGEQPDVEPAEETVVEYPDPGDIEQFDIGDLRFEAGEHGVRIARGGKDIVRLGPDGIQVRRGKHDLSIDSDGIRYGAGTSYNEEHFDFDSGRGDISIDLPDDMSLRVEVLVTGDIHSDMPLVGVGRPGPRGSTKRFVGVRDISREDAARVGVKVRTKRGDVALRMVKVEPRAQSEPGPEMSSVDKVGKEEQARVVLEALAKGALTVEEAERLLEGLNLAD